MYKVIEFDSTHDGNGGISVVRTDWLTPFKKECMWPPYKLMAKFNKALQGRIMPDENWALYRIKRIFYETDDLTKAREKCRKAESESEVATDWEEAKNGLKRKRKTRAIIYDSDESDEQVQIKYPVPPKDKDFTESPTPIVRSQCNSSTSRLLDQSINSPMTPCNTTPTELITPHISPLSISLMPTKQLQEQMLLLEINNSLDVIAKHLAHIKNELKEIREVQNNILLRSVPSTSTASASLPPDITLPCKEIQDLEKLDTRLATKENEDVLTNYFSYVGGNKTATIIQRILERAFTNAFALNCNWQEETIKFL